MQEYYKILNIPEDATNEEVENAYQELKNKYSRERFLEGEAGNFAAKQLTRVETAYQEIMASRRRDSKQTSTDDSCEFSTIDSLIKEGNIALAQEKLDNITDRTAEWHYLQSVIFYKKNWINESKKQLEIAVSMDPKNKKYSDDLSKLKAKMEQTEKQFKSGNAYNNPNNDYDNRQMGGNMSECESCCTTWCCTNLMCNLCCR